MNNTKKTKQFSSVESVQDKGQTKGPKPVQVKLALQNEKKEDKSGKCIYNYVVWWGGITATNNKDGSYSTVKSAL